ncbi:MAG: hypothetical protein IJ867_06585 [Clostridia bacterium]|nr:hypothetical protein [Clostridia bacterium]
MGEQVSTELLKILNDMANNETTAAKIDASIFIRESQMMINEKVAYLYNMLKVEAKNCSQRQDAYFEDINLMITHYQQKLNMVYDEFYCQYVNIQNELQEANNNRRIAMINYQKLVNQSENGTPQKNILEQKENLKKKNTAYQTIVNMCNEEFVRSREKFETMINEDFLIMSKSLQLASERNIFQKIISKFSNIFNGSQKYAAILKNYHKMIHDIDSQEDVEKMRNDTIEFVADVLEVRGIEESEQEEYARLGG